MWRADGSEDFRFGARMGIRSMRLRGFGFFCGDAAKQRANPRTLERRRNNPLFSPPSSIGGEDFVWAKISGPFSPFHVIHV